MFCCQFDTYLAPISWTTCLDCLWKIFKACVFLRLNFTKGRTNKKLSKWFLFWLKYSFIAEMFNFLYLMLPNFFPLLFPVRRGLDLVTCPISGCQTYSEVLTFIIYHLVNSDALIKRCFDLFQNTISSLYEALRIVIIIPF